MHTYVSSGYPDADSSDDSAEEEEQEEVHEGEEGEGEGEGEEEETGMESDDFREDSVEDEEVDDEGRSGPSSAVNGAEDEVSLSTKNKVDCEIGQILPSLRFFSFLHSPS